MNAWGRLQAVAVSSSVGQGLLMTALPLLAASLTTDPRTVSLVKAVGQSPWLLLSLFVGVLIDRVRRTYVLAFAWIVLAGAALVLAVSGLSISLLLVVAFLVSTSQVLGESATGALIPSVVEPARLPGANARLLVIDQGLVHFVVPPATGFVLAFGAGAPAWIALLAAVAAFLLTRGVPSPPAVPSDRHPLRDMTEGLRYLVRTRLLRSITFMVAVGSFATSATTAVLVLYAKEILHLGNFGYGVLLACMAAGWVVMSFFVDRIVTRFGYAWSMRVAQASGILHAWLLAAVPPWPWLVGLVLFSVTSTTLVWNVCSQSSRQRFTPAPLLGRVLTGHKMLAWGPIPLGALAGGFVAAEFGLRSVWVMQGVLFAVGLALVWRILSPASFREAELAAAS
ncbi:MFS transporter [Lentzea tibetensis]|uniref:MFS transporter n=1 Tax=Lentzea tibetensis TaxID=2591470 RepID=A0A563F1T8_9PSEU|nr:MFS transporter [Lentzea tibetensis]TWP53711.1 MFS transporter [Lentzea tibetensis]